MDHERKKFLENSKELYTAKMNKAVYKSPYIKAIKDFDDELNK